MQTKRIFAAALACLLVLFGGFAPLQAAGAYVSDQAGLFDGDQEAALEQQAQQLSDAYDANVLIVTSNQSGFSDNYARDVIEQAGTERYPDGYIGICIDMNDRSYWVDVYGDRLRSIFTQSRTDDLGDALYEHLEDQDYAGGIAAVLDKAEKRLNLETGSMKFFRKAAVYPGRTLVIGIGTGVIAAVFALLLTYYRVTRHKDKGEAVQANDYSGGLLLRQRDILFSHHYQTRVPVPKSDSSGGSHGGGSAGHTGSGGHF